MRAVMKALRALIACLLLSLSFLAPAMAQTRTAETTAIDPGKLLVQPRGQSISFLDHPVLWMNAKQREFYGSMSGDLRRIKSESAMSAALTLMLLSFGYGVFHAAGPGHGKAVISSWLIATESELRRGILVAFLSALIQALTAIILVGAVLLFVSGAAAAARNAAGVLESLSYAMICGIGLYLIWTACRGQAHAHHDHHHDHGHVHDAYCGHAHAPAAKDVASELTWLKAVSMSFAVGIRPCTGAILVLILAHALGLFWVGVLSTLAMAVGTFLTVSVIAAIAVYSKKLAVRLAERDGRWLSWLGFGLRLGGGAVIAGLGGLLLLGSLGQGAGMT
jgi:nickel/cobalt transporter (NicO) family protein